MPLNSSDYPEWVACMKQALLALDYSGRGLCHRTGRFKVWAVVPTNREVQRIQAWCHYHGLPVEVLSSHSYVNQAAALPEVVLLWPSDGLRRYARMCHPSAEVIKF